MTDDHGVNVIKRCVDLGINLIDTAEVYRSSPNKDGQRKLNENLVGLAVQHIGRDKIVVCSKHFPGGLLGQPCTNKEELRTVIRTACENSLKALGVDYIDLYYLHRMFHAPHTIEDAMECFKELVAEGKIKYVGLSEAPPDYIRRAHAVTPISAVQQEWSLIARDLEAKGGVVDTCRELGIGIVPYSPIARGFLAGAHQDNTPKDWRASVPYLSENLRKSNVNIVKEIESLAKEKGLTLSQLSLAWVINQGDDVFPIPGTTNISHLEENAKAFNVTLTDEELQKVADAATKIKGNRGDAGYMEKTFQQQKWEK